MPTLTELWTDRLAAAAAAETEAAAALAAAAAALAGPGGLRTAHTEAGAAFAAKAAEIASRRASLAEPGLSPAELAGRVAALRASLVEFRALRRQALDAEEALALGEGALEAARADHPRLHAEHVAAQAELAAATARSAPPPRPGRLERWHDALAAEPLVSVAARAAAAVAAAAEPFRTARLRVEGDVPAALRARALERYDEELARAALARDAAAEADGLLAGELEPVAGEARAVAAALAAAEAALGDHVAHADARVAAAIATFAAVAGQPPLTAAERAAIAEPGRVAAGEAALPLEKARDDARAALAAKRVELADKTLELLAADIDEELPAHPDIVALEDEVAALESDLDDAETALTPAMRADLDDWEAAVPDAPWGNLLAFEQAKRRLAELAALDPADLEAAVVAAEAALVTALEADGKRRRTLDFLRGAAAGSRRRNDVTVAVQDRRALGAVRGDQ
jgi:hypothetical protein